MRDYLETYKVIITTIGPLFIGDGKELVKREYVLNKKAEKATIIDKDKFFAFLRKHNKLESYENHILWGKNTLQNWLYEEGIFGNQIKEFTAYEFDCGGVSDLKQMKNILTCMKDAYGNPYVPGSSLKGAIRTCMIGADIIRNRESDKYSRIVRNISQEDFADRDKNRKKRVEGYGKSAEKIFFNCKNKSDKNDVVNDIMSGVRLSDSKPLSVSDLVLCQKIDVNRDYRENPLPILRECIKPGTRIEFDLTVDLTEALAAPRGDNAVQYTVNPKQLMKDINLFLKGYNNMFLSKFEGEALYDKDVIYLGGGAGFATKTILHDLLIKSKRRTEIVSKVIDMNLPPRMRNEHKHYSDVKWQVSPHTCKLTEYDGELYQMGACSIEIV